MKPEQQRLAKIILVASLIIVMLGFGIAIPLMPFYIIHFNASGSALGLMMSLYSLMQFLFAPMWGRLSRSDWTQTGAAHRGRWILSCFHPAGTLTGHLPVHPYENIGGIVSSATLPTAMAYMADITAVEDRSKGVGLMGASMGWE